MDETSVSASASKTILIIEDDEGVRDFLVTAIKGLTPFQALSATDAIQALEMVQTLCPELVILDYQLPGLNGLELYEKFQEREHLQSIPVLLMSANMPEKLKSTLPMPFIEKPFTLEAILEAIIQLLTDEPGENRPTNQS